MDRTYGTRGVAATPDYEDDFDDGPYEVAGDLAEAIRPAAGESVRTDPKFLRFDEAGRELIVMSAVNAVLGEIVEGYVAPWLRERNNPAARKPLAPAIETHVGLLIAVLARELWARLKMGCPAYDKLSRVEQDRVVLRYLVTNANAVLRGMRDNTLADASGDDRGSGAGSESDEELKRLEGR
jgi:hypothetical protein